MSITPFILSVDAYAHLFDLFDIKWLFEFSVSCTHRRPMDALCIINVSLVDDLYTIVSNDICKLML